MTVRRFERAGMPGVCPLCGLLLSADDPCGLLPWKRTSDPRIVEAKPAHWECITSGDYDEVFAELNVTVEREP